MSVTDELAQAITQMKVVEFRYKGNWRSAEPHAVGYSNRGVLTLCAWQLSGGSGQDWRDFHVEQMLDVTVTEENFDGPRDGYNPSDKTMSTLICAL